jgi:xanthine/uracil permease
MKRLVERFGRLITASFLVMAIGIVLFLLTPLLYGLWRIDSDLPGVLIVCIGLVMCIIGIIRRKKLHGWKLVVLTILAAVLCLPILSLIVSLIYYLITGKPLGS